MHNQILYKYSSDQLANLHSNPLYHSQTLRLLKFLNLDYDNANLFAF